MAEKKAHSEQANETEVARIGSPTEKKASEPTKSEIHAGHRGRLRRRFMEAGLDSFEPHQVLELLLTYPIPRKDVNEPAHALMERFGSLSAVLDAPVEELCQVKGIGKETAIFLKLLPAVLGLYAADKHPTDGVMDTADKITEYLRTLYIGVTGERAYLLLFDNAMHLIDCACVGEGNANHVTPDMRAIAEHALHKRAASAVLAHNHPGGAAFPSGEDRVMTDHVAALLDTLQIPLLEHFLVTKTLCVGILRRSRGILRASPLSGELDEAYWKHFYGEEGRR